MESIGNIGKKEYVEKIQEWKENFTKIMTKKVRYKLIPITLNSFDETKIKDLVFNTCHSFFLDMNLRRKGTFYTAIKIFEYPNRVLSIRILIVSYYKDKLKISQNDKAIYQITVTDEEK